MNASRRAFHECGFVSPKTCNSSLIVKKKNLTSPKWEIFYKILNSTPQNCPDHEKVNTNYSHRPKVTKET
jgi:hypothetical protein